MSIVHKELEFSSYMVVNMGHIIKKMICLCLVSAFLLSASGIKAYAIEPWPSDCYVAADGACLMDADSGTVLYAQNADAAYYPASITKVLTALVVLENCDNLNEQVTFSYEAVHLNEDNATIIGASEGDKLSVLDCLYCLLFQSANEVANALAEHVGAKHPELKEGSMSDRDVFVRMMNEKAASLGCRGSNFNNPSGLTDSNHYTTAYDMCLIMRAAIENEQFLDIERRTYWTHAPIRRYPDADDPWNTVYPKHLMMKRNSSQYYEGIIAGKTGYTTTAGNTLVTACERNGMRLVTCVLNGRSTHYNDTRRMMDFGFDNFTSITISDYDDINSTVQKDFSLGGVALIDAYTIGTDSGDKVCIPKSGSYVEIEKELVTGTEDGSPYSAKVIYRYGDKIVGSSELKLIRIDDTAAAKATAGDDPMLMSILGMNGTAGNPAAVSVSAGAGSADNDDPDADDAEDNGSVGIGLAANALADTDLTNAVPASTDGEELSSSAASQESNAASQEDGAASRDGNVSAEAVREAPAKEDGLNVRTILIYGGTILMVVAALFIAIRLIRERKAAKRRAELKAIRENLRPRERRSTAPSGRKMSDGSIGREEANPSIGDIGRRNLISRAGGRSGASDRKRIKKR